MPQIVVDLNTKVVPRTQKIWIVHAGRTRNYMAFFKEENAVFLEFPGFDLRPEQADDDAAIRQRLRYSQALKANRGLVREDGTPIRLADYRGTPDTDVAVHLRTMRHLTSRMRPGDLAVVPGRGLAGNVLFGEVRGEFFPTRTVRLPTYPFADIPVRSVEWLEERSKIDLPRELIALFEKPPAIAEVQRSDITDRFFDFAYQAYLAEGRSWLSIDAPGYDGRDFMSLVPPAQLIAFAIGLYNALDRGQDLAGKSFDEIILRYYDERTLQDAQLKFASPGRYNLKDRNGDLGRFINVVIALAMSGALTACGAGVDVTNSKAPPADADGHAAIAQMITTAGQSVGGDALDQAQRTGQTAHARLGLQVPARVQR